MFMRPALGHLLRRTLPHLRMLHCLACKRKTGSAFGFGAWFRENDVLTEGKSTEFLRVGDDGGRITNRFCPNCGATVVWSIDTIPGVVAVSVGTFADLSFTPPTDYVNTK